MHGIFLALSLNENNKKNKNIQLKVQCTCNSGSGTTGPTPLYGLHTGITHEPPTTIRVAAVGTDVVLQHLHKLPMLLPIKWLRH